MNDLVQSRRLRIARLYPSILVSMLKAGHAARCIEGLPSDAEVVGVGPNRDRWAYDPSADEILVVVKSESFTAVPDGEVLPQVPIKFVKID